MMCSEGKPSQSPIACLTASHHSVGIYLALEDFGCLSDKSVALALLAKFIAVLVSKMEFFSVPAPNACIGFVLDFLGHFPLYVFDTKKYKDLVCTEMHCTSS